MSDCEQKKPSPESMHAPTHQPFCSVEEQRRVVKVAGIAFCLVTRQRRAAARGTRVRDHQPEGTTNPPPTFAAIKTHLVAWQVKKMVRLSFLV